MDEHAGDILIVAPVAATDGVFEMHILVVAGALGCIAQTGLHAALGRSRVRTLGRHQAEDEYRIAALAGGECGA